MHIVGEGPGATLSVLRHFLSLIFNLLIGKYGEGNGNPLQCSCLENPGMEEPGRLRSMGSHRVAHD